MQIIKKEVEEKSTNTPGQIIFKFLPYWPLFLLLLVFSMGSAWLYLRYATPYYESNARILIKNEKNGDEEARSVESLDFSSPKKVIDNEIEIIQSWTLINEVVKHLGLYAPVSEEYSLKTISAYSTSPVKIEVQSPDSLKEVKKVYFSFDRKMQQVVIQNKRYPLNQWVSTAFGVLKFVANGDVNKPLNSGKLFFGLANPESVANGIQKKLEVTKASKLSSIIHLSLIDEVPQRGRDVLNQLLVAYNVTNMKDKNTLAANTLDFISDRLRTTEHDLDSIENRMQSYQAESNAVDISTQGKLYLTNVSNNDQKLSEINMQLAVLNQLDDFVVSKDNAGGILPSTLGVNDPTLSQLVDKLYALQLEYESLRKTTGENNAVLISLVDRIEKIKPSIIANIKSQKRNLEASIANLSATNSMYSSTLNSIPQKERDMLDINREHEIVNNIYTFLLQKKEETSLVRASIVSDSRIVDKARSGEKPVSPKKKVIYLLAILFAFFAGLAFIFSKETFSRKIMFRHEIANLTTLPIIGEISAESSKNVIVIGDNKRTFIAEQFRKLRVTLGYLGIDTKHKRIMVTSSISGEGKSFIATNLAMSLAMTGKKVALLDFDLNNPSLNNKLNIGEHKGITDYLLDESDIESIILQTDLHKNLSLIPTGKLPSNPSELIMGDRVHSLLNLLDKRFDFLVIDTAPVTPVSDAYILSPYCDATLFVVRHGYTPKALVQQIDENNKINHLKNVALVFNGVTSRGFGSKNYGYGYGYGYVYGNKDVQRRLPV
ncbi:MAG: polysaccharide biosynthesis tyrosine autokinase [Chitinophagaceae bacterium]